ncbi:MAG: radical SAM protein [Acidobacteriota bacterium]
MKLKNTILGLIGSRLAGDPFYARLHVTHRCDYRCRMCGQRDRVKDRPAELSLRQLGRVAERLAELGARHVVITGGEPFIRPDLHKLVDVLNRLGFSIRVQTNGGPLVTEEKLKRCAQAGLRDLSVSIDTLDEALQNSICQSRDVVPNALKTLGMARRILSRGITQANVVASPHNFEQLPSLVRYFHERGIYTYITPAMISPPSADGDGYLFRGRADDFRGELIGSELRERVIGELVMMRRRGYALTNSARFLEDYRRHLAGQSNGWRCEAGLLSLDVLPDGTVAICKEKHPFGHILDDDFMVAFRGEEYRRHARRTAESCAGCFYGEYREPQYVVHSPAVLWEWARQWIRNYRRGMRFNERKEARKQPVDSR